MKGLIDESGRALLRVELRSSPESSASLVDVWIDTGFTGELVLPFPTIQALGCVQSGSVDAILADGSQIELKTYTCFVEWFDGIRRLEVVANNGEYPLLGVGLLLGLELRLNYLNGVIQLENPDN